MNALPTPLRKLLCDQIIAARKAATKATIASLTVLAVGETEAYQSLSDENRKLRVILRAEARRLGDPLERDKSNPFPALAAEIAYAQWHRLLFARFLAENNLLTHPEWNASVTLQDCADIAEEEGKADAWAVASEYASAMLPGIFPQNDPRLELRLAPNDRLALEELLDSLPREVFLADDSLGWVYQFWQTEVKAEVNASGRKIGGADISPVTQLFTEHYMVQFLLHNSLGAWWAARHPGEALPTELDYLRRNEAGEPAAGTFSGWPTLAKDLRVLDPCCGSGHFLVAAFILLLRFRMLEEGLSAAEAGDAVLRDNLFGLELDPRCTQLAVFAVCIAAWKSGGYRPLPLPNIACSGLAVGQRLYEWTNLAEDDANLQSTLTTLYHLFENAPDLGSLIDPARAAESDQLLAISWEKVAPLLDKALAKEKDSDDPGAAVFGGTAKGVLRAAQLLAGKYHLVVTNVPYLARGKQGETLRDFCELHYERAKAELATVFVERCINFCAPGGSTALVTPQNWLFLGSYKGLRGYLLRQKTWNLIARLGFAAFSTPMFDFNVMMVVLTNQAPQAAHFSGIDASNTRVLSRKEEILESGEVVRMEQAGQLNNPDNRIVLGEEDQTLLLELHASAYQGIKTGDDGRFRRNFWEVHQLQPRWRRYQSTVDSTTFFGGCEHIIDWSENGSDMARLQGIVAWGKFGVAVSQMSALPVAMYFGDIFDSNMSPIVLRKPAHLTAVWCFCSSPEFNTAVRRIDQSLKPTNATLVKIPFDLAYWQTVAEEKYPDGLPKPFSSDPTQWLFNGHPFGSDNPLHVAVARLLGYHWPRQTMDASDTNEQTGMVPVAPDGLEAFADNDGIVCLPTVAGEKPADQRLRALLAAAYGEEWSHAVEQALLTKVGANGKALDEWLRDSFFTGHCSLFHNRPFLWQIWDGEKDGFSAIVNYHRLNRAALDRLTYTYLNDWIELQRHADNEGVSGAGRRLKAALGLQEKLKAIAHGEPPFDIYVRWKPLHKQALGWEPDLNDGVRMNIRPFIEAGVLRSKVNVNWKKDRGADPLPNASGTTDRLNDLNFTRAKKELARQSPTPEPATTSTSGKAVSKKLDL